MYFILFIFAVRFNRLLRNKLPQTKQPKTTHICYCTVAVGQEFGHGLVCREWAGSGRGDAGLISLDTDSQWIELFLAPHFTPFTFCNKLRLQVLSLSGSAGGIGSVLISFPFH